jgi:chromosomal replication initiation ATPase DnaA
VDKSDQLPLDLPLRAAQGLEDLVISSANREAVGFVESWPDWPNPIVVLAGPVGAGKSHLATIWKQLSGATRLMPEMGMLLPTVTANVVVEDIEAGNFDQAALFHLINNVRAHGGHLLLTSRVWPGNWGLDLADLQSRMKLAHLIELGEPDDDLLRGVLTKLFSDRQIEVDPTVVDFLVLRMERSLACAQNLVGQLDKSSMAQKRAITKPLAASALRQLELQV